MRAQFCMDIAPEDGVLGVYSVKANISPEQGVEEIKVKVCGICATENDYLHACIVCGVQFCASCAYNSRENICERCYDKYYEIV